MRGKGRPSLSGAVVGGKHPPYAILGPCPCSVCGALLYYARGVTRVNGIQTKGLAWWREPTGRMHRHETVRRGRIKAPNRYPQLANARAEWDNRAAGSSSESGSISHDARLPATTRLAGVVAHRGSSSNA